MSQPQRLDNRRAVLRHVLIGVTLGLLFGIIRAENGYPFSIVDWISLTLFYGVFGACLGWCRRQSLKHNEALHKSARHRKGRSPWGELRTEAPSTYRSRLARFLDCEETDLKELRAAPVSRMKFWCLWDEFEHTPAKPIWFIRRLLLRIRATVRDGEI